MDIPADRPQSRPLENVVLIAGPTAGGKSALAMRIAEDEGGTIINADSMQVYSLLRILTARPSRNETERVPHRLYGHVAPGTLFSTGAWLREVRALVEEGRAEPPLIFVGGTGLYFHALTTGMAEIPEIPSEVRAAWRTRLVQEGAPALHSVLAGHDPAAASSLAPADGQRVVRALEVLEATGRPIREWQSRAAPSLVDPRNARAMLVEPERSRLHARIERRFDRMVEEGALEEVRQLLELGLAPDLPAMKAIGVRELAGHLSGETDLASAITRAKAATRQYAKRQSTWFRNRPGPDWTRFVDPGSS